MRFSSLIALGLSTLAAPQAFAEEAAPTPPAPAPVPAPTPASDDDEDEGPSIELSGFIDGSLTGTFTAKGNDADKGLQLGLDQVELDIDVELSSALHLRIDLQYYPAEDTTDGALLFDAIVEQGYAETTICDTGLFVKAGKWNAPIGYEVIDPTGLLQYSYGLLFTYATPANLTGLAFGWANDATSVQLWLSNGWDQPSTRKAIAIGGRFQQALGDVGTIGVSGTYGAFAEANPKLMLDVDLALVFGDLKVGAEFNYGNQNDLDSIGALVSLNYAFSSRFSLTLRGDYLDREIFDSSYKGAAVTVAGLTNLAKGLDLIAELRADMPDGQDTIATGALELLASF